MGNLCFLVPAFLNNYKYYCCFLCFIDFYICSLDSKCCVIIRMEQIQNILERKKISKMHSVQFISVAQLCVTLSDLMNRSTPGLPVHHQLPEFTQTHVHRVGDASSHLILCCLLFLLPPIPPSIRVFSNESTLGMRWPKVLEFQL